MIGKAVSAFIAICIFISAIAGCRAQPASGQTVEKLREKYPLYTAGNDNTSVAFAPFQTRIKNADAICFATVKGDATLFTISTEPPSDSKEFTDKHPDTTQAGYYVYPVEVNELIAGKDYGQTVWIYMPEYFSNFYPLPRTGDHFFLLLKTQESDTATRLQQNEQLSGKALVAGTQVFYVTEENTILSILSLDDMTCYDMMAKADFRKKMKELWDKGQATLTPSPLP